MQIINFISEFFLTIRDDYLFFGTISSFMFIKLLWFFFIFDLPRYIFSDLFLLIFAVHERKKRKLADIYYQSLIIDPPLVSVLIPGRNEGNTIARCVISMREQTHKNIEIIVVDDGSDDNMEAVCRDLLNKGLIDKFLRNEERGGKASAANSAFRLSTGRFIVHVDADSSLDRDAIQNIIKYFYNPKVGAVAGNLKVREPFRNPIVSCQAIEYLKTITIGRRGKSSLGILRIVSGAFGAFRREMIEEAGGWDIGPGLDGDITVKAIKGGWKVTFAPDAICLTNTPSSLTNLVKQRLRWNRSLIRFRVRKHSNVFIPHANFSYRLFFSHAENLFFNVFLSFNWLFYLIFQLLRYPDLFRPILLMNFLLYFCMNILQVLISLILSERKKEEAKLLLYTPLMFLYVGYLLRPIRIISYLEEIFFKRSYSDEWNPAKVSKIAKKEGL